MATSLSQQLQRLTAPQTGIALSDARSRASILFNPKEAATKDRRTIYEIGVEGLNELIALNPDFKQFKSTLFDEATIELERSVEHIDVNKLIDINISKFLQKISPYFLLRPSHMCIEWLLRRFYIHEFNRKDLFALILPYHETNLFVQVLQTMRIKQNDVDWAWLRPIQKPGVPLPKSAIINRASSTPSFLAFICKSTLQAVQELGARANQLQTQINFFTTVIVGAIQNAQPLQEWHISTMLEVLLNALSSEIVDFVAAAYIIVAQLVSRNSLKPKLCNALVERVSNCAFESLRTTALLLLIWIFDTQTAANPDFTEATLLNLIRQKWLTVTLASLAKENIATEALFKPIIRGSVHAIQKGHPDDGVFKHFLDRFLIDVELSASSARELIDCFLDAYESPPAGKVVEKSVVSDNGVIELDSDDDSEMVSKADQVQSWYSDYLFRLEKKYPTAFDIVIKKTLQSQSDKNTGDNRSKAIRLALGFRLKYFDDNAKSVYECLYHFNPEIRLVAVQKLLHNIKQYQCDAQNSQVLKGCLADRINDDSEKVVACILKIPTDEFVKLLGADGLAEALFNVLQKAQLAPNIWGPLVSCAIQHLTSMQLIKNCDKNLIMLAFMPFLFSLDDGTALGLKNLHFVIKEILDSPLTTYFEILHNLSVSSNHENFNVKQFKELLLEKINNTKVTQNYEELLCSIDKSGGAAYLKTAEQVTHLIMLLIPTLKQPLDAGNSLKIFTTIQKYCNKFEFSYEQPTRNTKTTVIPHQIYTDFLITLVQNTNFGNLSQWTMTKNDDADCLIHIFNVLATALFQKNSKPEIHIAWKTFLKRFFDTVLPSTIQKIDFLLNFCVYTELPQYIEDHASYTMLRVHALKLLHAIIGNNKNEILLKSTHILQISCGLAAASLTVRLQTLEILKSILNRSNDKVMDKHLLHFLSSVTARSQELSMDREQYALILFTILQPSKPSAQQKIFANKLQNDFVQLICGESSTSVLSAELLMAVRHINNESMLSALLPLAHESLKKTALIGNLKILPTPINTIYQHIVERFDKQTLVNVLIENPLCWKLFEESFKKHDVYTMTDKLHPLPCVILNTLTPELYELMPIKYKLSLLQLIIEAVALSDNDSIFLSAHRLLKKCCIDCQPLVAIITQMHQMPKPAEQTNKTKRKQSALTGRGGNAIDFNCGPWRKGIALLELLEHKKNLRDCEHLIPPLFDLLKVCLEIEEQSSVEYPKQLILSTLLHCCQCAETHQLLVLSETSFRIEQIVHCLRATQNPQTQRNALLLLTHCAKLFPQQVLHNVVAVFTFMGSSLVRHDDAFSFHIINNIIETIVPILVTKREHFADQSSQVIPVLKVFSDIMLDVPEHRRLPLYTKLLETLDPVQHIWQFLCVVFETYVLEDEKQRLLQQKIKGSVTPSSTANKRIIFVQELTLTFAPKVIIETCIQLLDYIKGLPTSTDQKMGASLKAIEANEAGLFDIKCRSSKQLRHYKYVIMQFMSAVSSSTELTSKLAGLSEVDSMAMKPYYQNFIIKALSYVAVANNHLKAASEPSQVKFWKVLLHHVHDVLDNAISLLLPEMLLIVVNGLMKHELLSVRKKVIQLLITKLQKDNEYFNSCKQEHFQTLFQILIEIIEGILIDEAQAIAADSDLLDLQQTALVAIKLLSKVFGLQYLKEFNSLLHTVTKILKKRAQISTVVIATVVVTIAELASNLKAHAIAHLPKFMPHVIQILREQVEVAHRQSPDNICLAVVSAIHKLFECLPLFLGPYIVDIITLLASISTQLSLRSGDKDQRAAVVSQKLSTIWIKIASDVPMRILAPSCEQAYRKHLATHSCGEICVLMDLLLEAIKRNDNAELKTMQNELYDFFQEALEFRLQMRKQEPHKVSLDTIDKVEEHIIDAFVAWILKLSEGIFRPMYHKVYEWALKRVAEKETMLTYFLLSKKIAVALKSLFVLFASDFIEDAANLLNNCNTLKQPIDISEEKISIALIDAVLGTLFQVFLYNSKDFVNAQRFNILMLPIVDQLENRLVLEQEHLQEILQSCISQLAVSVSSDVLWKQLNYQVLLKTRTNIPEVRIFAFNCCVEVARKLGEDYTPLLPETVPFIAELFEDENSRVEKNTRKSVQELETILGESLQKYL